MTASKNYGQSDYVNLSSLPYFDPKLDHKVAIVLNGDNKCGFFISLQLYLHGYIVYMGSRNNLNFVKTCDRLRKEIKKRFKIDISLNGQTTYSELLTPHVTHKLGRIEYLSIDMKDLKTVVRAATRFQKIEKNLHLLLESGGGYLGVRHQLTKDGFDLQLQTHYLAQALIALLLTQQLDRAEGKIIFMSSVCHFLQYKYYDNFQKQTFDYSPHFLFSWFRYALAKTLSIQFLKIMAIKHPKISCYSINPGVVINTNIFSSFTRLPLIGFFFWLFFQMITMSFGVSEEQGASSVIGLALRDSPLSSFSGHESAGKLRNLKTNMSSGKYFDRYSKELKPSQVANNLDNSTATWISTVHLLRDQGITIPTDL